MSAATQPDLESSDTSEYAGYRKSVSLVHGILGFFHLSSSRTKA